MTTNKLKKILITGTCCIAIIGASAVGAKLVYDKWFNPVGGDNVLLKENASKDVETHTAVPQKDTTSTDTTASAENIPVPTISVPEYEEPYTVPLNPWEKPLDLSELEPYEAASKNLSLEGLTGYQNKYPGLYAEKKETIPVEGKTVYFTFDDGPSKNTNAVLEQLDQYGIKATFFVATGSKNTDTTKELLAEIAKRGHTIAIHTHSHNYKEIYASVDAFLKDMDAVNRFVYEATGIRAEVYRFPGGSKNAYNKAVAKDILNEMERRGFKAFDWNSSLQDAEGKPFTQHQLAENAISTFSGRKRVIVLAHDGAGQKVTPYAIGEIVDYAKKEGYVFATLDGSSGEIIYLKR